MSPFIHWPIACHETTWHPRRRARKIRVRAETWVKAGEAAVDWLFVGILALSIWASMSMMSIAGAFWFGVR